MTDQRELDRRTSERERAELALNRYARYLRRAEDVLARAEPDSYQAKAAEKRIEDFSRRVAELDKILGSDA